MPQSYSPVYFPQDWSPISMSAANQFEDSCTDDADNNIGNYATLSPLNFFNASATLSEGNLKTTGSGTSTAHYNLATISFSSGKYIYASIPQTESTAWDGHLNLHNVDFTSATRSPGTGIPGNTWTIYMATAPAMIFYNGVGGTFTVNTSPTWALGDYLLHAVDADNNKLWFGWYDVSAGNTYWLNYNSGSPGSSTWDANPASGSGAITLDSPPYVPSLAVWASPSAYFDAGQNGYINTGVTIPSGFKFLNTANLPEPTVKDSSEFFKTVEFSGTGSAQNIDTVGFQPDLLIIKSRTSTANFNWVDSVRGAANILWSNADVVQSSESTSVTGFRDAGFSVGSDTGSYVNISGQTMVAFCMKAGGAASSNVEGSVTSSVSAASHGGFSIGTYSGTGSATTVGHGLSRAPSWVIVKMTSGSGTQTWTVWQEDIFNAANADYIILSSSAAKTNGASFSSTAPSSTVISIGNDATNQSGSTNVFYAFAKTPGLIGSGSYTGNGSADGPMIVVDDGGSGFKPAWLMVKRTNNTDDWKVSNSVMSPFNPVLTNSNLNINTSAAADTPSGPIDYLANGFKPRLANGPWNASGDNYIYLAFAENPFGGSDVAQARAR